MARKGILLVLLFACTMVCADPNPVFGLDFIKEGVKDVKDALSGVSGQSDEDEETDTNNEIETDNPTSTASDTYWDCSNSTLNVRRCVLRGNVTKPETLVVYRAEVGKMEMPCKPPKGVLGDFSSVKSEGPLDEIISKIEKTFKAVFDFLKEAMP